MQPFIIYPIYMKVEELDGSSDADSVAADGKGEDSSVARFEFLRGLARPSCLEDERPYVVVNSCNVLFEGFRMGFSIVELNPGDSVFLRDGELYFRQKSTGILPRGSLSFLKPEEKYKLLDSIRNDPRNEFKDPPNPLSLDRAKQIADGGDDVFRRDDEGWPSTVTRLRAEAKKMVDAANLAKRIKK